MQDGTQRGKMQKCHRAHDFYVAYVKMKKREESENTQKGKLIKYPEGFYVRGLKSSMLTLNATEPLNFHFLQVIANTRASH